MTDKIRLHYLDRYDDEKVVEIDRTLYRQLLSTKTGRELAEAVEQAALLVTDDPRRSELDDTGGFFSHVDTVNGYTKPDELLAELDDPR